MKPHKNFPLTLALAVFVGAVLYGCKDNANSTGPDQIVGSGRIITRADSLASFTAVNLNGFGDVFIAADTVQSLRLEADDNIIDRIHTSVASGVLTIGMLSGSYSNCTVRIYIAGPPLEELDLTGAGNFTMTDSLHFATLTTRITGAGNMTLQGSADDQIIEITGAGAVHSFALTAANCTVTISGTGNAEVTPTAQLEATITGIGTITYAGDPSVIHQTITGIGQVRKRP